MKRAFTMIELLIYMGMMSILLVLFTNIFLAVLDVQLESESTSLVQVDARTVLSRLMYDVHRAAAIITPAADGQTGSVLTLNLGGSNITYSVSGGKLLLGSDPLISYDTDISNFTVTRIGNPTGRDTVRISFTLTSLEETRSYQTTVSLRN